jgi:hypothetical protein
MGQDRAGIAIARIERALARIEAAAARPAPAPTNATSSATDDHEVSELRRAHQALRSRVEGAIAQIDGLIASGEQD